MNKWDLIAYGYMTGHIQLGDIVKFAVISGWDVEASDIECLFEKLLLAVILISPQKKHEDMARILKWSRPAVSKDIKTLCLKGCLRYERKGRKYRVLDAVPGWIQVFVKHLINIDSQPSLKEKIEKQFLIQNWELINSVRNRKTR